MVAFASLGPDGHVVALDLFAERPDRAVLPTTGLGSPPYTFAIVTVTTTIAVTARLLEGLMIIRDGRADGCRP